MKKDLYKALWEELSKLINIPPEEYEKLLVISHLERLNKGEYFVRVGEKPTKFGFILSGIFRLFYTNESGDEFNKTFCIEKDFLASYSALLRNQESRMSIQALEDSTLLVINFDQYLKLLNTHTCWQILSRLLAENLFIKKEQRESQFLLDSAETRYLAFKKEYPNLEKRINQYHIASYLGITPVALSRIRAKLIDS